MKIIEELGMFFPKKESKQKKRYVLAICPDCEKPFKAIHGNIKYGITKRCNDCGVKATSKKNIKHGDKAHNSPFPKLYNTWCNMKSRCSHNSSHKDAEYYLNKGISVCKEWEKSYPEFKEWALNNGFDKNLTIDRINNNGNYEPSNCRWVKQNIQTRNTVLLRKTNTSGYRGVYKSGKNWRVLIGIDNKSISIGSYKNKIDAAIAYDEYVINNNLEHTINFNKDNYEQNRHKKRDTTRDCTDARN